MSSPVVTAQDRVLADLAALDPGGMPAVALLGEVRRLARFADQVHGELARLIGVMDARGAHTEAGYGSAAGFLRHGCGRSPARAGELVAAGRGLRRLAATGQALAAGEVSFDAAHVICRAVAGIEDATAAGTAERLMLDAARPGQSEPGQPQSQSGQSQSGQVQSGQSGSGGSQSGQPQSGPVPADGDADADGDEDEDEDEDTGGLAGTDARAGVDVGTGPEPEAVGTRPACGDAGPGSDLGARLGAVAAIGGLDPGQLRRLGEELAYRASPEAVEDRQRKRFERRYLSFGLTVEDTGTISGACGDALSLEIIRTAAEAFSPPGGAADTRTAAQRRMDGLTAACQAALDSGTAPARHGAAPHVSVLAEEATLAGKPGAAPAQAGHGALLTARQVMALACRAEISLIRCADGVPLDVGRMRRTETPGIRRALAARDRGCRWPGCGLPAIWCTAHHIRPWAKGGHTSRKTMILLCFVHHQYFLHYLGWVLTGDPDATVTFTHPAGWLTLTSPLPTTTQPRAP